MSAADLFMACTLTFAVSALGVTISVVAVLILFGGL
jgi:hypothetical protein